MSQPRATSESTPALMRLAPVFMLVAALVATVGALATITTYSRAMDASNAAFENTADGLANPGVFALIMQVHFGICALTALGLFVLTTFMLSGSEVARVATTVFCVVAWPFVAGATFINPGTFGWGGVPGDAVTIASVSSAEGVPA